MDWGTHSLLCVLASANEGLFIMPALMNTVSMSNVLSSSSTFPGRAAKSVMSSWRASTRDPRLCCSAERRSCRRPATMRCFPRVWNRLAKPSPRPEVAPMRRTVDIEEVMVGDVMRWYARLTFQIYCMLLAYGSFNSARMLLWLLWCWRLAIAYTNATSQLMDSSARTSFFKIRVACRLPWQTCCSCI